MRDVTVARYVAPLRSGGSVPGIVEADDLGTYVVKFSTQGALPAVIGLSLWLTCGDEAFGDSTQP